MVVLSVVDIVLLIAGLAFYLYVVGASSPGSPRTSRSAPRSCARSCATPSRSSRASSTSTAPAGWSPARCRCCTGWPRASSRVSPLAPRFRSSAEPARPASGRRRSRLHDGVGYEPVG